MQVPLSDSKQLTLRIILEMKFFSEYKNEVFKERTQVDEGPYTLEEWSGEEGFLLNIYMKKAYQELAEQIVESIQPSFSE